MVLSYLDTLNSCELYGNKMCFYSKILLYRVVCCMGVPFGEIYDCQGKNQPKAMLVSRRDIVAGNSPGFPLFSS